MKTSLKVKLLQSTPFLPYLRQIFIKLNLTFQSLISSHSASKVRSRSNRKIKSHSFRFIDSVTQIKVKIIVFSIVPLSQNLNQLNYTSSLSISFLYSFGTKPNSLSYCSSFVYSTSMLQIIRDHLSFIFCISFLFFGNSLDVV